MAFAHLHLHTIYSFLDGIIRPNDLMTRLKDMGMNAAAITDHGNMHGVVDFYLAAEAAGIKPIIGMESYISAASRLDQTKKDAFHLLLLAENETGYKNLCYMNSQAFIDGFYYKPRIDRELLKEHSSGIIACSACLGGEIAKSLMEGDKPKALRIAREYQEIFGKDNFFIEIQVNGIEEQNKVNPLLIELAREIGAPLVGTNDVHYLRPEHSKAQDILFCINAKTTVDDKENRLHHETDHFYLKTEAEMREAFDHLGEAGKEAIDNTTKIVERCTVKLDIGNNYLPNFDTGGVSLDEYLRKTATDGLEERFIELGIPDSDKPSYYERLNFELGVIINMKFPGYFLIVADFIQWAKKNDIPVGPGRGSGAGSLVAYSLKITDLNPIRYGLFFERFLNPERVSMPDFDVDFCQDNRDKVIEYVSKKYGSENVAQIATFGQLKAKSAVRDVARALSIDLQTADKLAKIVPENFDDLLKPQSGKKTKDIVAKLIEKYEIKKEDTKDPDKLKQIIQKLKISEEEKEDVKTLLTAIDEFEKERQMIKDSPDFTRIIEVASQIEGLYRQPGKHACGLVIADKPIWEYSPIFVDKDNLRITQYDKTMVENVGLVKFDFLGLKTLTMIKHAETLVKKKNPTFDISKIPIDDAESYKMLCVKSTKGVFQMESAGFEKMIHQMKPDRIEDLIAGVALYRPGPMDIIPNYIRRKHGKEAIEYDHPWIEEILKETMGLIVYQEQVMQISQVMAGFSLGKADILRRAMGKKKPKEMEKMKYEFREGAKEKGVDPEIASKVFDHMEKFASYGFNKSHAACYGYISYQTAYLKQHYPVEFFTALISSESSDANKVLSYISDARNMGISVFPPDTNKSDFSFTIEENAIRFGLGAIKNVGENAIEEIISERKKSGFYKSLTDFAARISQSKVNSRAIEYLIKGGAFDFTGINRGQLVEILPAVLKEGEKKYNDAISGQMSLFGMFETAAPVTGGVQSDDYFVESLRPKKIDSFEALTTEKEVLGVFLSDHPANYFRKDIENLQLEKIEDIIIAAEESKGFDRKKKLIAGVVTTEIKAVKGRDGDYYIKGTIEDSNSAIDFIINNIDNPQTNPILEKMKMRIPLIFSVSIRVMKNQDDGTFEGVRAAITDEKDVKTFTEYLSLVDSEKKIRAVIETDEAKLLKSMDKIDFALNQYFDKEYQIPLILKLNFPDKKASAYLEHSMYISDNKIKDLKEYFGFDNFFLYLNPTSKKTITSFS